MASVQRRASFEVLLRTRVLATLIRVRMFGVFVVAAVTFSLTITEPTPARVVAFVLGVGLVATLSVVEFLRASPDASTARLAVNVWLTGLGQAIVVLGAGGLASPLIAAQVLFAVIAALFTPPAVSMVLLAGVLVPAIWIYAYLQASGLIPGLVPVAYAGVFVDGGQPGSGPWLCALLYSLMILGGTWLGRFLRRTIHDLVDQQAEDRERALEMHAEQSRTLSALSSEIAHELKNPLASVKGLAALVSNDVEGKVAERVGVMRREVDRMQAVLDEFLAYSRPLVPLEAEELDLVALANEVVEMHEGVAVERNIRLAVAGQEDVMHARFDPRKIRAVLVNLVQNALDASGEGSEVRVDIRTTDAGVEIHVLDRGAGIDPNVAARLFTVGATTKPKGNGIGLPMSRGLVRQHGGELVLERREGGGAIAKMTLPTVLPVADSGAAT